MNPDGAGVNVTRDEILRRIDANGSAQYYWMRLEFRFRGCEEAFKVAVEELIREGLIRFADADRLERARG